MATVYTVNAFTDTQAGGNPAGVVLDTVGLNESDMKAIAADVGFSETAFVSPSERADVQIRFFTPADEVDLCGHATIATCHLMREKGLIGPGSYTQETKAGLLNLTIGADNIIFMDQNPPDFGECPDLEPIYASLNLTVADGLEGLPPQIVSTGLWDLIVPVKNLDTLLGLQPDFQQISCISQQWSLIGYHVFCLETLYNATAHCRNFAPLFDIPEEAATGTASGALSSYLYQHQLINQVDNLVYEQGLQHGQTL